MMRLETWREDRLVRRADDAKRELTAWDAADNPATRPYTTEENAEADKRAAMEAKATNETSIRDALEKVLTANSEYLKITYPTAAETTAQVRSLTVQVNGVIRLMTRRLESGI